MIMNTKRARIKRPRVARDQWHHTHDKRWPPALICDAAQDHPAKFAYALIDKIYRHCLDEGWLCAGDTVLDPFGGVALGAFFAVTRGLNWVGVELEPHFVEAGQQNIKSWHEVFGDRLGRYGHAALMQGDSTKLSDIIHQLGMDAAVASPPFIAQSGGTNVTAKSGPLSDPRLIKRHRAGNKAAGGYGKSGGQLASMKDGTLRSAIASPPFSTSNPIRGGKHGRGTYDQTKGKGLERQKDDYSDYETAANLANAEQQTFWSAALLIVTQVYDALPTGGHAVWVCKNYVRKGVVVDFAGDWKRLCEHAGFTTLHRHDAVLVEDIGTQYGISADDNKSYTTSHKSMFKRTLEKAGKIPPIDEEVVWCMVKGQQHSTAAKRSKQ